MNAVAEVQAAGWAEVDINELAAEIADESAMNTIQQCCPAVVSGERLWFDTKGVRLDDWACVDRAVAYLERRGDRARWRLVRGKAFPTLLRFEGRA